MPRLCYFSEVALGPRCISFRIGFGQEATGVRLLVTEDGIDRVDPPMGQGRLAVALAFFRHENLLHCHSSRTFEPPLAAMLATAARN